MAERIRQNMNLHKYPRSNHTILRFENFGSFFLVHLILLRFVEELTSTRDSYDRPVLQ